MFVDQVCIHIFFPLLPRVSHLALEITWLDLSLREVLLIRIASSDDKVIPKVAGRITKTSALAHARIQRVNQQLALDALH